MAARDFSARYEALRAIAQGVNHDLRVIVAPGRIEVGQDFTLKPFEADALELGAALDRIEEYLATPKAAERGELYRLRDEAKAAETEAFEAWQAAMARRREAVSAVRDDLADELEADTVVSTTAGELRADLAGIDTPESREALDRIRDLPDDASIDVGRLEA